MTPRLFLWVERRGFDPIQSTEEHLPWWVLRPWLISVLKISLGCNLNDSVPVNVQKMIMPSSMIPILIQSLRAINDVISYAKTPPINGKCLLALLLALCHRDFRKIVCDLQPNKMEEVQPVYGLHRARFHLIDQRTAKLLGRWHIQEDDLKEAVQAGNDIYRRQRSTCIPTAYLASIAFIFDSVSKDWRLYRQ